MCFSPYFMSYHFSRPIITGPTVDLSHFSHFPVFLDIFQVLPWEFLIFLFGQFSCHIPGPTRHIPGPTIVSRHISRPTFSHHIPGLTVLKCAFPIFHVFQCSSPYFMSHSFSSHNPGPTFLNSYSEHFSFTTIFSVSHHIPGPTVCISHFPVFLAIFQVIQCLCLIFHVFQFSRHNPGPIFLECVLLILPVFQCFLPYSRSYR
ncbi:hypothetical protein T09_3909, partial [Trichinella sp. T9]